MNKVIILLTLISLMSLNSCTNNYDKALNYFNAGDLTNAREYAIRTLKNHKMAERGKALIQRIDAMNDSITRYNDSIYFIIARQAYLSKSYEKAILVLDSINCNYSKPSAHCDSVNDLKVKAKEEKRVQDLLVQLDREIASLKNQERTYIQKSQAIEISTAIALLGAYQTILTNNKNEKNKAVLSKLAVFEGLVKSNRIRVLPKLRKDYARILGELLWEHNVDVKCTGSFLYLTGSIFASNRAIKEVQGSLADLPRLLRFKRVTYRWYEDADGTYYSLKTPQDTEPFILNN